MAFSGVRCSYPYSALLRRKTQKAEVTFTGQNGKVTTLSPKIVNGCGGSKKGKQGTKKAG